MSRPRTGDGSPSPAFAMTGKVREREGSGTLNACPHGHFETEDRRWVAIACTNDKMFARLCEAMARPDLAARWAKVADRLAERQAVDATVAAWTAALPLDAVMTRCLAAEVPCGPLNTIADIFADPHYAARENLACLTEPGLGEVVIPNVLPRLSATPGRIDHLGPALGEANRAIYGDLLGLDADEIARLREAGVI
ncbi:MAG: CoA transferase [Alphaproteobacteria bacterium]|nr:CoA transferase [Alphaproteobacteria bacterium]